MSAVDFGYVIRKIKQILMDYLDSVSLEMTTIETCYSDSRNYQVNYCYLNKIHRLKIYSIRKFDFFVYWPG